MRFLKLTHANLKRPVWINFDNVVGFSVSMADGECTHVVGNGAIYPVSETPEQITSQLATMATVTQGEVSNGNAGN